MRIELEKWDKWKGNETSNIERERLKVAMKEVAQEISGRRQVDQGRKGNDWWNKR